MTPAAVRSGFRWRASMDQRPDVSRAHENRIAASSSTRASGLCEGSGDTSNFETYPESTEDRSPSLSAEVRTGSYAYTNLYNACRL